MQNDKLLGSILIIVGTMIGAGMLAIPIISAGVGFPMAAMLLVAIWMVMTVTGLFTLEVNLAFEPRVNGFSSMSSATLGKLGKAIAWSCILVLLYSLTAAYIAGNASLLNNLVELVFNIKTPHYLDALVFLLVMGTIVAWSTKAVDYCNRVLLGFKGLLLISTMVLLAPQVNFVNIIRESQQNFGHCFWAMVPIFICSFGYHPTIPSISNYLNCKHRELRLVIIYSTTITLCIYLLWLLIAMGVVPWLGEYSFSSLIESKGSVGDFVKIVYSIANNKWTTIGINGFSNIAMTTSFLGVALGLFDFLADGFKRSDTSFGRFQTALLAFTPPFVFAIFYPNGFIMALKYAALFATVLVIIFPPLMAYKLRKNDKLCSPYRVFGGEYLIVLVIGVGIMLIGIQASSYLGWLV